MDTDQRSGRQDGHSPAGPPQPGPRYLWGVAISLRTRLGLSAALVVAVVVGLTTFLLTRIVGRTVEAEALDGAAAIALGVSADLGEHAALPRAEDLVDLLGDYRKAVPAVRSITVVDAGAPSGGQLTSTEVPPPARALELGRQAVARGEIVAHGDDPEGLHFVAVPLERAHRRYGAVVVAVGMDALRRVEAQSRLAGTLVALGGVLLLALALDLLSRRLVLRPIEAILATMRRAAAGDLQARAPLVRADEIGSVAAGLNVMLERTAGFNDTLRAEVERATGELRAANRELLEAAQRLFAARRELARSQRLALAGQMAASVAHRVGTPLSVLSGHVQLLRAELPPGSPAADRLRVIQEQIARVTATVQGLLDQARHPELERRPLAPGPFLEKVAELVRPALRGRGVELHLEVEPGLPSLSADAAQLEQALLNLATNALDALPVGGHLGLGVRREGDQLVFTVEDDGAGIAPEDQPRVFEPLFTTKPRGRGTGLGLPIVREVAEAHGGRACLESRPGAGIRARLSLPLPAEPSA